MKLELGHQTIYTSRELSKTPLKFPRTIFLKALIKCDIRKSKLLIFPFWEMLILRKERWSSSEIQTYLLCIFNSQKSQQHFSHEQPRILIASAHCKARTKLTWNCKSLSSVHQPGPVSSLCWNPPELQLLLLPCGQGCHAGQRTWESQPLGSRGRWLHRARWSHHAW